MRVTVKSEQQDEQEMHYLSEINRLTGIVQAQGDEIVALKVEIKKLKDALSMLELELNDHDEILRNSSEIDEKLLTILQEDTDIQCASLVHLSPKKNIENFAAIKKDLTTRGVLFDVPQLVTKINECLNIVSPDAYQRLQNGILDLKNAFNNDKLSTEVLGQLIALTEIQQDFFEKLVDLDIYPSGTPTSQCFIELIVFMDADSRNQDLQELYVIFKQVVNAYFEKQCKRVHEADQINSRLRVEARDYSQWMRFYAPDRSPRALTEGTHNDNPIPKG